MADDDIRVVIAGLAAEVRPADEQEAADQADIAAWIESGAPLFRTAAPATPRRHLVVYFVPVDAAARCVLLGDHVKSGLWLPPGGHVDPGEDPRRAVEREARGTRDRGRLPPAGRGGRPVLPHRHLDRRAEPRRRVAVVRARLPPRRIVAGRPA